MDLFEQIRQREEEKIQQKESKLKELRSKVQQKDRQFFLVPPTSAADDSNSDKSILRLLGLYQMDKYLPILTAKYLRIKYFGFKLFIFSHSFELKFLVTIRIRIIC